MGPKRLRNAMKFDWEPLFERQRMRWVFCIGIHDVKCYEQLIEELAPFGYRPEMFNKRSRRKYPRGECLTLVGTFTEKQIHTEIMRVHKACDRLGLPGLDDLSVETLDTSKYHIN